MKVGSSDGGGLHPEIIDTSRQIDEKFLDRPSLLKEIEAQRGPITTSGDPGHAMLRFLRMYGPDGLQVRAGAGPMESIGSYLKKLGKEVFPFFSRWDGLSPIAWQIAENIYGCLDKHRNDVWSDEKVRNIKRELMHFGWMYANVQTLKTSMSGLGNWEAHVVHGLSCELADVFEPFRSLAAHLQSGDTTACDKLIDLMLKYRSDSFGCMRLLRAPFSNPSEGLGIPGLELTVEKEVCEKIPFNQDATRRFFDRMLMLAARTAVEALDTEEELSGPSVRLNFKLREDMVYVVNPDGRILNKFGNLIDNSYRFPPYICELPCLAAQMLTPCQNILLVPKLKLMCLPIRWTR